MAGAGRLERRQGWVVVGRGWLLLMVEVLHAGERRILLLLLLLLLGRLLLAILLTIVRAAEGHVAIWVIVVIHNGKAWKQCGV